MTAKTSPLAEALEGFFEVARGWLQGSADQAQRVATRLESPSYTTDDAAADLASAWALSAKTWAQGALAVTNAVGIMAEPPTTYSVHGPFHMGPLPDGHQPPVVKGDGWGLSFNYAKGVDPTEDHEITVVDAERNNDDLMEFRLKCVPSPGVEEPKVTVTIRSTDGSPEVTTSCLLTPNNQVDL